jgi:hypothetical protein
MGEVENRSSAPTPEQLGAMNVAIAAAVREAVSGVFAQLGPVLKDMAITPEKLREANKPYQDPAKIARELREGLRTKAEEAEMRRLERERKDNCMHIDANGRSTIQLVHNYPDRQTRGICAHCQDYIHPKEWRIGPPTPEEPRGHAYMVEPHKNYSSVKILESQRG